MLAQLKSTSFKYNLLYQTRLPWVRVTGRNGDVPEVPGAYAVYDHGQLVYIGSTINLRLRLRAYARKARFDRDYDAPSDKPQKWFSPGWSYTGTRATYFKVKLSTRNGEWLMREWRLITRLKPRYNINGVVKKDITRNYWWPRRSNG